MMKSNEITLCGITQQFSRMENRIGYEGNILFVETLYFSSNGEVVVRQSTPFDKRTGLRYTPTSGYELQTTFYFKNGYAVLIGENVIEYDNCPYFNVYDKDGKILEVKYKSAQMEENITVREYLYGKDGRLLLVKDYENNGKNHHSTLFSYDEKFFKTTVYSSILGDEEVESELSYIPNGNGKFDCHIVSNEGVKILRDVDLWECTKQAK